jgi:hypothetical protein
MFGRAHVPCIPCRLSKSTSVCSTPVCRATSKLLRPPHRDIQKAQQQSVARLRTASEAFPSFELRNRQLTPATDIAAQCMVVDNQHTIHTTLSATSPPRGEKHLRSGEGRVDYRRHVSLHYKYSGQPVQKFSDYFALPPKHCF